MPRGSVNVALVSNRRKGVPWSRRGCSAVSSAGVVAVIIREGVQQLSSCSLLLAVIPVVLRIVGMARRDALSLGVNESGALTRRRQDQTRRDETRWKEVVKAFAPRVGRW